MYDIDLKHLARMEQERARIKKLLEDGEAHSWEEVYGGASESERQLIRETVWWMSDILEIVFTDEMKLIRLYPPQGDS